MKSFLLLSLVTAAKATSHGDDPVVGICSGSKEFYKDMSCCGGKADMKSVCMSKEVTPAEKAMVPPLPGIMPGAKPKILLGYAMWSPYVYINDAGELTGFGPEFIKLMQKSTHEACSWLDIRMVQDVWSRCWNDLRDPSGLHPGNPWNTDVMGDGPTYGLFHGGITYTHLKGVRPRMGEFSHAITKASAQPSGILVKLDANKKPMVSPKSDLSGMKIIDVANYAPTIDTFALVQNWCNDGALFAYDKNNFISPPQDGNKAAMALFKSSSDVQLMYTYADQAYDCAGQSFKDDCEGWEGLGTEFAYLHVGLDPNINGTTISFHKMNSGVSEVLNPCIQAVLGTKEYHDLCLAPERPPTQTSTNMAKCFPNSFWTDAEIAAAPKHAWHSKQNARTDSLTCKDGYCTCSELPA